MSLYPRPVCSAIKIALLVSAATLLAIAPLTASADETDLLSTLKGHKGAITVMSFSPDGKLLCTAAQDNKVLLWSTETGKKLAELADTKLADPLSVAWAPSGNLVAVSYKAAGLYVWDVSTPEKPPKKIDIYPFPGLAFSPDGKLLVGGSTVYDVDTRKRVASQEEVASPEDTHLSDYSAAATRFYYHADPVFSPDGKGGEPRWFATIYKAYITPREPNPAQVGPCYVGLFKVTNTGSTGTAYFARSEPTKEAEKTVKAIGIGLGKKNAYALVLRGNGQLEKFIIQRAGTVHQDEADGPILRETKTELLAARVLADGKSVVTIQRKDGELKAVRWDLEGKKVSSTGSVEPGNQQPLIAIAPDGSAYALTAEDNTIEVHKGPAEAKKSNP